ncbi:lymphocyte antigen 6E-like isoform X1 [Xenopus tropicalis]|uniref:Lymphocyte antigen 6E-like isoform X1 n=1 Tax=Xenopus tropicalis TaxID=8364 RepID=A0A8J1JR53_XENTR|nr:lymphocyte antigen 6E-like isoform X1 [Xenopus tropicalis]
MAALYVSLLLAALCIGTVVPLKCYTCLSAASNADCKTQTDCGPNDAYCQTVVGSVSGKKAIGKYCTPSCTPGSSSFAGITGTVSCCKTNLCNTSGAPGVKYSYPALGLSLGFLLVLLRGSAL